MMLFENRLIFRSAKQGPYEADRGFRVEYRHFVARDGVRLHGAYIPVPDARGAILWCHGNGGNLTYGLDTVSEFRKIGMSSFLFDYRGYGESEGSPNGPGIQLDAQAAYDYLTRQIGVPAARVVILGESLGGAPAIKLASECECAGLIVQSAFTSMRDMASAVFPYLPWLRFFVRTDFPNLDTVSKVRTAKLFIHSRGDELVPFWMAEKLYTAASEPKEFYELVTEGHNETFGAPGYFERVRRFLDGVLPRD